MEKAIRELEKAIRELEKAIQELERAIRELEQAYVLLEQKMAEAQEELELIKSKPGGGKGAIWWLVSLPTCDTLYYLAKGAL